MTRSLMKPRFSYGRVMLSTSVIVLARAQRLDVLGLLDRHLAGDWGDVSLPESQWNDIALVRGGALISRFVASDLILVILTHQQVQLTKLMLLDEFLENDVD